jgi:predicted site-specific integrase-resolvase
MTDPKISAAARQRSAAGLPPLLTRSGVAQLLRADPTTVTRWADTGRLSVQWTPGGTRRYRTEEILAVLNATT